MVARSRSADRPRGLLATPEAVATLTKLLGHAPRGYEAYVKETSAMWRQA